MTFNGKGHLWSFLKRFNFCGPHIFQFENQEGGAIKIIKTKAPTVGPDNMLLKNKLT